MKYIITIVLILISVYSIAQNTVACKDLKSNRIWGKDSNVVYIMDPAHFRDTLYFADGSFLVTAPGSAPEVIDVAKSGMYTSVKQALDSINDNSVTKPYIIRVAPGIYTESPFSLKPYVYIEGSGPYYGGTTLQTNDTTVDFITGVPASTIGRVCIKGPKNTGKAAIYYNTVSNSPFIINEITIKQGYYGIHLATSGGEGFIHCFDCSIWSNSTPIHDFIITDGEGILMCDRVSATCQPGVVTNGFTAYGPTAELTLDNCSFEAGGSTNAVFVNAGAIARINQCIFAEGTYGIHIGSLGASEVKTSATTIREGGFTKDIYIESPTATMLFTGSASSDKFDVINSSNFNASFTNRTAGIEGQCTYGEFYLGTDSSKFPMRDYAYTTFTTGYVSGGKHSRLGGLSIKLGSGEGYINTSLGINKITWDADTLTYPDNSLSYTYVDKYGVLHNSTVEPDKGLNILLGVVRTYSGQVVSISRYKIVITHPVASLYDYLITTLGPLAVDGNIATEHGQSKQIDVSQGHFYISTDYVTTSTHTPITFYYWNKGVVSGTWVITQADTINRFKYDNGTGTLATVTNTHFKKDALYINYHNDTTEYHIVYSQEVFDDVPAAEAGALPLVSSDLSDHALLCAGVISGPDSLTIISITDERPFIGSRASTVTTPAYHNDMLGLNDGDYKHLTAAEYTGNGTGNFVRTTNAIMVTPTLGNATVTSLTKTAGGTGIAKFNANVLELATFGIDYSLPLTFTAPLSYSTPTNVEISLANSTTNGYLSMTDWIIFNAKTDTSRKLICLAPLSITGNGSLYTDRTITITQSNGSTNGYLSSVDWTTFNNKENTLTFSTGLTRNTNTITNNLSTGVPGGQTIYGGVNPAENLVLHSTADVTTRGHIQIGGSYYDEVNNRLGISVASPTAALHLRAGVLTASGAPLKFTAGTNLTSPEAGAVEFDGTNYYVTSSTTRYTLAKTLTNTASLNFPSTGNSNSNTLTMTVTGAADGDPVIIGVPLGSAIVNSFYKGWVSAPNTITVQFTNVGGGAKDPSVGTFRATVIKY